MGGKAFLVTIIHVFFLLAYIFWKSGSDMLSQNFKVSSDYACDMLTFVCFPNFFIFIQSKSESELTNMLIICLFFKYI